MRSLGPPWGGPSRVARRSSGHNSAVARILIVGGGYIGMYAARRLERRLDARAHELTLVNPENFMLYQPFLPEVASGLIDPRAVVVPLRRVLRRTQLVVGEVEAIDLAAKRASVRLAGSDPRGIDYDVLVMGAGSWSRTLAIPGLAEHGVGFKDLAEAIWLRNRVLSQLDRAAELADPDAKRAALTFVFVGGGFAGIEALGELEDLARSATVTIPTVERRDQRWIMIEAAPRILPELDPDLAGYAADRLRERDIEIRTSTRLDRIDDNDVVHLSDGDAFWAETLVWTAGVRASPLAATAGFPVDERGRVRVDPALRVVGVDSAWAAGDVAAVPDDHANQGTSPPTAQHALRQARVLADNVAASLQGGRLRRFSYENKGMLCSLGHYRGVANPFGIRVKGFPAWFLHRTYHLLYMPSFARKARIALDWTIALLFPRDLAQLGSLEHPRDAFRRAAGGDR
jgi:NADH dehydrogenase